MDIFLFFGPPLLFLLALNSAFKKEWGGAISKFVVAAVLFAVFLARLDDEHLEKSLGNKINSFSSRYVPGARYSPLVSFNGVPPPDGVSFSRDGKRIISAGGKKALSVWDSQTGHKLLNILQPPNQVDGFLDVRPSPDGRKIACTARYVDGDTFAKLLIHDKTDDDIVQITIPKSIQNPSPFSTTMRWSPNGNLIAYSDYYSDNGIIIWSVDTGQIVLTIKKEAMSLAWSPDGNRLAYSTGDITAGRHEVRICDAQTGQPILTLTHCNGPLSFSPDGKWIITGAGNGLMRVWDAQTGQENLISRDSTKTYFDPDSGREINEHNWGHFYGVACVCWSPDGKWILSGGTDFPPNSTRSEAKCGGIRVWSFNTGEQLFAIKADFVSINSVSFSPDGKRLVTGSGDVSYTIKVWDVASLAGAIQLADGLRRSHY